MTASTILIAAFSGRSLAQSAQRAGYLPLVADAFGDLDTRTAAHHFRAIEGAMEHGFRAKPMLAALDALVAAAPSKPIGLVLGSGFEDKPRLVEILHQRFGVLGCSVEALRACKDPQIFFPVLDELGIAHPETRMTPPDAPEGWLSKRIGGSGGRHIRDCNSQSRPKPRRYFQRFIEGERISVSALIARDGITTEMSRQWTSPSAAQPYRYGGAVSLTDGSVACQGAMLNAVDTLARGLNLRGLASFDFIVASGTAHLLEINPRPGATLDVFDGAEGALIKAHIAACQDTPQERNGSAGDTAKAAAILHADRGPITLGHVDWPEWSADRGAPGTQVPQGEPLATVFASAETPDAAQALARARLAELESLIYESTKS